MKLYREEKTVLRGVNALARKLKVSRGHLSLVLNGKREVSPRLAERLAKLGIDINKIPQ